MINLPHAYGASCGGDVSSHVSFRVSPLCDL